MGLGDLQIGLALIATFVAMVTVVAAVRALVTSRKDPVRSRLEAISQAPGVETITGDVLDSPSILARREGRWGKLLVPVARFAKDTPENMGRIQERLAWAGYRGSFATEGYLASKLLLALGFGGAVLVGDAIKPLAFQQLAMVLVVATSIGFYGPSVWLRSLIARRQKAVTNTLPDSLDLLVSCVEAGLALEAALERVARDITISAPVLSQELLLTVREMEAGLRRSDCFRRLAARTGVSELKSLAAILVQTEMFGTSVGKALRVLAESLRVQRMQRAHERAATVAVRLTIPLILCLLPSLMIILLGGAAVRIIQILFPTLKETSGG